MKQALLDLFYPIGIVLEFVNGTDPNDIMYGQVWEKLPGGYHLLSTDNNEPSGSSTSYESNHVPGMTFKGGLPNIQGKTSSVLYRGFSVSSDVLFALGGSAVELSSGGMGSTRVNLQTVELNFDVSRGNERYGAYQGTSNDNVIGNHIAAVMWKRVS